MITNSLQVAVAERAAHRQQVPAGPPVIAVQGLRKSYGENEAVRGIDLEVRQGEILALLGPNGAGKTTTIEILEGFLQASAGSVEVLGEDPARASSKWRRRLGIVLQESATEPELTVLECLQLYAGYYEAPADIDTVLDQVGLSELAERRSGALSGGERRRLDVALALIGDPELIFLDEPTTGFDPAARRASWDVIEGLKELGKTIILTTHYMEEAERLADRIAVIVKGEVASVGTPQTIGERDHAEVVLRFDFDGAASALPQTLAPRADVRDRVAEIEVSDLARDLNLLTGWALDGGVDLSELKIVRSSLEDVYLQLTGNDDEQRSA